jgi:hypothetical protein
MVAMVKVKVLVILLMITFAGELDALYRLRGPALHNSSQETTIFAAKFKEDYPDQLFEMKPDQIRGDPLKRRFSELTIRVGTRELSASEEMIENKIRIPSRQYWIFDGKALCVVDRKRFKPHMVCPKDALRVEFEDEGSQ